MPEFLCPTTGKPCERAQATGEVLGKQVLSLFGTAAGKVAELGNFAPLEMRMTPATVDNFRKLETAAQGNREGVKRAIIVSKNTVVANLLPVFVTCGEDTSGAGIGCGISENESQKKTAVSGTLEDMVQGVIDQLNNGEEA